MAGIPPLAIAETKNRRLSEEVYHWTNPITELEEKKRREPMFYR